MSPTYTITLDANVWEQILTATENYRNEGPENEGWQSEALRSAAGHLERALNEEKSKL